ncbi:SHOCT domain-containing protein, partial [Oenococcus oeni]
LEQLTQLKKLLDSGVITKKEFEAKKKQILGL